MLPYGKKKKAILAIYWLKATITNSLVHMDGANHGLPQILISFRWNSLTSISLLVWNLHKLRGVAFLSTNIRNFR